VSGNKLVCLPHPVDVDAVTAEDPLIIPYGGEFEDSDWSLPVTEVATSLTGGDCADFGVNSASLGLAQVVLVKVVFSIHGGIIAG